MNEILARQLALDYCCSPEEVKDGANHFALHRPLEGRRRYKEDLPCVLKIAAVNGKLLFCGSAEALSLCRQRFGGDGAAWFFEPENLRALDRLLRPMGVEIAAARPFYIAEEIGPEPPVDAQIRWYGEAEIEPFRGDARFGEAFTFLREAPDRIGVAALREGRILGMAGASADSPTMWQIGINVEPDARLSGLGTALVARIRNAILRLGILPYYGTSISHLASQRVALGAGFRPAWAELVTAKI